MPLRYRPKQPSTKYYQNFSSQTISAPRGLKCPHTFGHIVYLTPTCLKIDWQHRKQVLCVCVCEHMASCDTPMLPRQLGSLSSVAADVTHPVTTALHLSCVSNTHHCPGNISSAVTRSHLTLKTACSLGGLLKHGQLKPECFINM